MCGLHGPNFFLKPVKKRKIICFATKKRLNQMRMSLHKTWNHKLTVDVGGQFVIPGFVQAHTHLVQTLFRGEADDLSLLNWLQKKIWPMEAAHNPESVRASALYGCLEMQKNGTTSILDMGTVRHTSTLLEAVETTGIRFWGGKCLMDRKGGPLAEATEAALSETKELLR